MKLGSNITVKNVLQVHVTTTMTVYAISSQKVRTSRTKTRIWIYIVTAYTGKYVCTRQICKKQKIVPHRHDISRISDSTISTSHSIRYEIIEYPSFQHYPTLFIQQIPNTRMLGQGSASGKSTRVA